ncbi:MAG: type II CAAX endopeptidase family protein [Chloroflexota bacterium]
MIQESEIQESQLPPAGDSRILTRLWDWKDIVPMLLLFGFIFLVTQIAAIFLSGATVNASGGFETEPDAFLLLAYGLGGTAVSMLIPVWIVNLVRRRYSWSGLGLGAIPTGWVWPAVGLGIAAAFIRMGIGYVLLEQFPALSEGAEALNELFTFEENWQMIAAGLLATLIVPFYEEVFFRGIIHNAIGNRLGMWGTILFSSFLFGVFHGFPIQIITAFLLGLVLGWLYEKSDNLWPPIICHTVNNGIAMLLSILSVWLEWGI